MKKVDIFTDGACSYNPGPGGWGALLRFNDTEKTISGYESETTNNRMELMAAIKALEQLKEPCQVNLTTDSQYVRQGMTTWIHNWKKLNWTRKTGKEIANVDLWKMLDTLSQKHKIQWHWVKAHAGHLENERVDALARAAIETNRK